MATRDSSQAVWDLSREELDLFGMARGMLLMLPYRLLGGAIDYKTSMTTYQASMTTYYDPLRGFFPRAVCCLCFRTACSTDSEA